MSITKEILRPINDTHSIKEAVITLFLSNPIIKPERFDALIKNEFKEVFQKFEPTSQVEFQFKGKENGIVEGSAPLVQENVGFIFSKFDQGKTVAALQARNEVSRTFISYHSLDYSDWDIFFDEFIKLASTVANFHSQLFVNAFSLHYIDEFEWLNKGEIDAKQVFNENATLLPKDFFQSKVTNYQLVTLKSNSYEYYDRIEIKVEQRPKTFLTVSHNVVQNLNDNVLMNDLISSAKFKEMLYLAHEQNKNTLENIFREDVCSLIGLK